MRCAGRVFDADEMRHLVDASLDFWLTTGRFAEQFEREFARVLRACATRVLVELGLLARTSSRSRALTRPKLGDARASARATRSSPSPPASRPRSTRSSRTGWCRSSSTSTCRPTTSTSPSSRRRCRRAPARSCSRTRWATRSTSTRSPPSASEHDLWLVEDCCDARRLHVRRPHGRHLRRPRDRRASTPPTTSPWARAARCSPTRAALKMLVESFRDWGRDCWCEPGQGEHLRQALRLAARRPAARLRPQVHLLAHRLQPEGHRHAGGGGRRAAATSSTASSPRGGGTSTRLQDGLRGPGGVLRCCPRRRRAVGAELVRLPDRAAARTRPFDAPAS